MEPLALVLAFVLLILLPVSGVAAGVLAWWAFRAPLLSWRLVGMAVVILVTPYVLAAVIEPDGGLELAFSPNPLFAISPLVAIGIGIAAVRRYRKARDR